MACLRKKGNKYYVKDVVAGKGKWFRTGTGDLCVAEVHLEDYVKSKKLDTPHFPPRPPSRTILKKPQGNLPQNQLHQGNFTPADDFRTCLP